MPFLFKDRYPYAFMAELLLSVPPSFTLTIFKSLPSECISMIFTLFINNSYYFCIQLQEIDSYNRDIACFLGGTN